MPTANFLGCYNDHVKTHFDAPPHLTRKGGAPCDLNASVNANEACTNGDPNAPGAKGPISTPPMTNEVCNQYCQKYKYFGTQNGKACHCGNSYGSMGKAKKDSACSATCEGDSTEMCGGPNLNTVYSVMAL